MKVLVQQATDARLVFAETPGTAINLMLTQPEFENKRVLKVSAEPIASARNPQTYRMFSDFVEQTGIAVIGFKPGAQLQLANEPVVAPELWMVTLQYELSFDWNDQPKAPPAAG